MPAGRSSGAAVVSNGYVYYIGGSSSDATITPQTGVYYGKISNGQVVSWTTASSAYSLPQATQAMPAVTANGYVYTLGGILNSTPTYTTSVWATSTARVNLSASLDLVSASSSVLTDGGDQTGSSGGTLTAGNTTVVGTLNVADQANFAQGLYVGNNFGVNNVFNVDVGRERLTVGPTAGDTTGAILVLGNKTNAGDPATTVAGAMYYNSNMGQFRCYTNAWHACGSVPIDQSYEVNEEWLTGNKLVTPIANPWAYGSNNWALLAFANNCSGFTYAGGAGGVAVTASRPGILSILTTGSANSGCRFRLGSSGALDGGNMIVGAGEDIRASVAVSSAAANTVLTRVGMDHAGTGLVRDINGVYWEADGTTNANWEYCYGTGAAATCNSSGVAVVANTFVSLEIQVISSSAVTFIINHGAPIVLTGLTISATAVFPDLMCENSGSDAAGQNCYYDYYQLRGDGSAPR